MGVISSILGRVMVKIIADFTSIFHFRHPCELGGLQLSLGMCLTLVGLPIAVWFYGSEKGQGNLYEGLRTSTFSLLPLVVALLAILFLTIEQKYIKTFVSIQRVKDFTINR